ncbi:hypothetical protein [Streptomyces sp. SID10853]|uniref:hypothetical protein n=1 Tax=Streptomyces sp. SID10853 TaxID=2706028 RepID=UPI0031BAD1A6
MLTGIRSKIDDAMPALLILISIGMLIGTWTLSGTIPMIVDWGLKAIQPSWIVVLAFAGILGAPSSRASPSSRSPLPRRPASPCRC